MLSQPASALKLTPQPLGDAVVPVVGDRLLQLFGAV